MAGCDGGYRAERSLVNGSRPFNAENAEERRGRRGRMKYSRFSAFTAELCVLRVEKPVTWIQLEAA
jgi:hypothetical protein